MVPRHLWNLIFHIILIFYIIVNAQCEKQTSRSSSSRSETHSYKYYSKASRTWKTMKYTDHDDGEEGSSNSDSWEKLSTPEECARPCRHGAPPKTCHFVWTMELYHIFGRACQSCTPTTNTSISSDCQCILADGADVSGLLVVNRQIPGPAINKDFQHYDGVSFLTQCPILPNTEFRYQWRAQHTGTYFWHGHTGFHRTDGIEGPLIIRLPIKNDPNRDLYDHDGFDHHMYIQDWLHDNSLDHVPGNTFRRVGAIPDNFLINGRGQWLNPRTGMYTTTPLAVYNVRQGERYRIRMINSCSLVCPIELQIENHNLTIIALDGTDVQPHRVTTITSFPGERVDFVLNANRQVGAYWIQLRGLGDECGPLHVQQHAILRYESSMQEKPSRPRPSYSQGLPRGVIFNPHNDVCNGTTPNVVCVKDLKSSEQIDDRILNSKPDIQIYLPLYFHFYDKNDLFHPNRYQRFMDPNTTTSLAAIVDGVSNIPAPAPPISQREDIPDSALCPDPNNLPARCDGLPVCHCTHAIDIPLNVMVEVIWADIGPLGLSHPIHLHGYGFYVMGTGLLSAVNITNENRAFALQLDRATYPPRSFNPPVKDTLALPSGGYTITRFISDNPGWWLYHCHIVPHLYNGMSTVFHVGEDSDLPPTPPNFPRCGNFKPKIMKSNPVPRSEL